MKIEDALKEKSETTWIWSNDKQDYIPFTQSIKLSEAISICKDYLKKQREGCVKTYELWYEETEPGYKSVIDAILNSPEPE